MSAQTQAVFVGEQNRCSWRQAGRPIRRANFWALSLLSRKVRWPGATVLIHALSYRGRRLACSFIRLGELCSRHLVEIKKRTRHGTMARPSFTWNLRTVQLFGNHNVDFHASILRLGLFGVARNQRAIWAKRSQAQR